MMGPQTQHKGTVYGVLLLLLLCTYHLGITRGRVRAGRTSPNEMLLTWLSVTGMVVGPVLRPAVSLLASPRHASPCAVDRVDRATAVRLGAAAVVAAAPGVGVAPAVAAYPTLTIETTAGPMEFELWDDVAPAHVNSFRKLAQKGYFDGQASLLLCPALIRALTLLPGLDPDPTATLSLSRTVRRRSTGSSQASSSRAATRTPRWAG